MKSADKIPALTERRGRKGGKEGKKGSKWVEGNGKREGGER